MKMGELNLVNWIANLLRQPDVGLRPREDGRKVDLQLLHAVADGSSTICFVFPARCGHVNGVV